MERAKTSGRVDDTEEIILKRLRTYNEMSKPVVALYKKRGLVVEVDGAKDVQTVWEETKRECSKSQLLQLAQLAVFCFDLHSTQSNQNFPHES